MAQKVDVKYVDDLDGSDASGTVALTLFEPSHGGGSSLAIKRNADRLS